MAHTPGPWTIEWEDDNGALCENGVLIDSPDGPVAFNVIDCSATLIAAAPELLAALHDIITCAHISMPYGGRAYCISDDRMDAARAAINKAEGRTDDQ